MTEADWLVATDPKPILRWLLKMSGYDQRCKRKMRLAASASCRLIEYALPDGTYPAMLELAERFADGGVSPENLESATEAQAQLFHAAKYPSYLHYDVATAILMACGPDDYHAATGSFHFAPRVVARRMPFPEARLIFVSLLRDIFGNPFRPVVLDPE